MTEKSEYIHKMEYHISIQREWTFDTWQHGWISQILSWAKEADIKEYMQYELRESQRTRKTAVWW